MDKAATENLINLSEMENSVGGEKINGIRVKSLMRVLLLIFLAACRASEIVLGTVSSLKVKGT